MKLIVAVLVAVLLSQCTVADAKARRSRQDSYDSFYDRTDAFAHNQKAKREVREQNVHTKAVKELRVDFPDVTMPQTDVPSMPNTDIEMPNMPVLPVDAPVDVPAEVAPVVEAPVEVPVVEVPVVEVPVVEVPAEVPAVEVPAEVAPVVEVPAEVPAVQVPVVEVPAVVIPEVVIPEVVIQETTVAPAPVAPAPIAPIAPVIVAPAPAPIAPVSPPIPQIVLPRVVVPVAPKAVVPPAAPAADFDPFFKNPKQVAVKAPGYTFTPDAAFDFTAELDSTKVRLNAQVDRQNDAITDKFNDEITPMLKRLVEDVEMLFDVTAKVIERFDLKAPAMDLIRFIYYITTKTSNGIVVLQNYSTNTLLDGVVGHYKTSINTAIQLVQDESSKFVELIPTSNDCVYNVVTNFSTDAANSAYKILNQDAVNDAIKNFYTKVAEFQQAITVKQNTLANSIRPATLNKAPLDAYDRIQDVVTYMKKGFEENLEKWQYDIIDSMSNVVSKGLDESLEFETQLNTTITKYLSNLEICKEDS